MLLLSNVPIPSPDHFVSPAWVTLRCRRRHHSSKILDCAGKAYESLSVAQAKELFKVADDAQLAIIAEERGWVMQNGALLFNLKPKQNLDIPAFEVIGRQLGYAMAIERIV